MWITRFFDIDHQGVRKLFSRDSSTCSELSTYPRYLSNTSRITRVSSCIFSFWRISRFHIDKMYECGWPSIFLRHVRVWYLPRNLHDALERILLGALISKKFLWSCEIEVEHITRYLQETQPVFIFSFLSTSILSWRLCVNKYLNFSLFKTLQIKKCKY